MASWKMLPSKNDAMSVDGSVGGIVKYVDKQ